MPETKILTVPVKQLLVGDVILSETPDQNDLEVTERPSVKVKFAYVPYRAEGVIGSASFPKDSEVQVSRVVPTEEEAAEQQRERALKYVTDHIALVAAQLTEARAQLIGNLEIRDPSWHGRYWEGYAQLQLENELWTSVVTVAANRGVDYLEAAHIVRDDTYKNFVRRHNFLPRSTSALSNHVDSLRNDVTASWLRELEYMI
jgi:hypothetical protein